MTKTASPKKVIVTPTKKNASPAKAASKMPVKRIMKTEDIEPEEIVNKKAKQSQSPNAPNGRKSPLAPKQEEPTFDSDDSNEQAKEEEDTKSTKEQEELHEMPTVMVTNLRTDASVKQLKELFQPCGKIGNFKVFSDWKTKQWKACIKFKEVDEARYAKKTINGKLFQGLPLSVNVLKTAYIATKDNAVVLGDMPKVRGIETNETMVQEAMNKFGEVVHIRFALNHGSTVVQFKENASVLAALKAGSFDLMENTVTITPFYEFQTSDCKVILHGLDADTTEDDVKEAVSEHYPVESVYFPKHTKLKKAKKNQVVVCMKDEESAKKLMDGKTVIVKNAVADVLPHQQSKYFCDSTTGVYFRHPAAIFAENFAWGSNRKTIHQAFRIYGRILEIRVFKVWAMVIFEGKDNAQKALEEANAELPGLPGIKLHAVDGTYAPANKPTLAIGRTVLYSNINAIQQITKLIARVKELKHRYIQVVPHRNLLTDTFMGGVFIEFETEQAANEMLTTAFVLNERPVTVELYHPSKHDALTIHAKNMILVKHLEAHAASIDLIKPFQGFGKITNSKIWRDPSAPIAYGFVEFKTIQDARKALKYTNFKVNGKKVELIKPSLKIIKKIISKGRHLTNV